MVFIRVSKMNSYYFPLPLLPPFLELEQGGWTSKPSVLGLHRQKLEGFTGNTGISCLLFLTSISLHGVSIHQ